MVLDEIEEHFPYKVVRHENCEADDIIATLVENTQEFGKHEGVCIVSSDKDFAQLQKYRNVFQWSPMKKGWIKEGTPRKQLMELILKGDQSDGVPNVLSPDHCFVEGIRQTPLRKKQLDQLMEWFKIMLDQIPNSRILKKDNAETDETTKSTGVIKI